jgi:hypothetical protein
MSKNQGGRKPDDKFFRQLKEKEARMTKIKAPSKKGTKKESHKGSKKVDFEEKEEKKIIPRKMVKPKMIEPELTGIKAVSFATQLKRALTQLAKAEVECCMLAKEEKVQMALHRLFLEIKVNLDLEKNENKQQSDSDDDVDEDLAE